jgi:DNA-binding CsgD family transcriptional regulator
MVATAYCDVVVVLCDWQGKSVWTSAPDLLGKVGDVVWKSLTTDSQEVAKSLISRAVTLRESQEIEVTDKRGKLFRGRLWPLHSPELAVCLVGGRVPTQSTRLGPREVDCLRLLSQGIDARTIAEQLDLSPNTVHTHLKRAREKLELPNLEALIAVAARYFCEANGNDFPVQ